MSKKEVVIRSLSCLTWWWSFSNLAIYVFFILSRYFAFVLISIRRRWSMVLNHIKVFFLFLVYLLLLFFNWSKNFSLVRLYVLSYVYILCSWNSTSLYSRVFGKGVKYINLRIIKTCKVLCSLSLHIKQNMSSKEKCFEQTFPPKYNKTFGDSVTKKQFKELGIWILLINFKSHL